MGHERTSDQPQKFHAPPNVRRTANRALVTLASFRGPSLVPLSHVILRINAKKLRRPSETRPYEGSFDRLKRTYRQGRGLVRPHRNAYVQWSIRLCPR